MRLLAQLAQCGAWVCDFWRSWWSSCIFIQACSSRPPGTNEPLLIKFRILYAFASNGISPVSLFACSLARLLACQFACRLRQTTRKRMAVNKASVVQLARLSAKSACRPFHMTLHDMTITHVVVQFLCFRPAPPLQASSHKPAYLN
jgi:hypothetical protein